MDVVIEGEAAVRHLDQSTSNDKNASVPMVATKSAAAGKTGARPTPGECAPILKKYPVQSYSEQRKNVPKRVEAHHVIQNSHFQYPRGTTIRETCPGYSEGEAPCIPLSGGSNPKTKHGRVSKMQKADARRYRHRLKEEPPKNGTNDGRLGKNPTYGEARADAKKQLTAKEPAPALTETEAECILIEVDKAFRKMCGPKGLKERELRAPGQRGIGFGKEKGGAADGDV
jgi:hypothetical protein